jgi:formylglycine-generating enzyme required for sulfatase activity
MGAAPVETGAAAAFSAVVLVSCWALLVGGCSAEDPALRALKARLVTVPGGSVTLGSREGRPHERPRHVAVEGFQMGARELSVSEFAVYLDDQWEAGSPLHPQMAWDGEHIRPQPGTADWPVAHVSLSEAQAYCRWLSRECGALVRLPTEDEWEHAARGGIRRARYPWGWGGAPGRACYRATSTRSCGTYAPNALGLYDVAGNVYEWCVGVEGATPVTTAYARGGSWAERDEQFLAVYRRVEFPADYRDADVGFRIVVESAPGGGLPSARNL